MGEQLGGQRQLVVGSALGLPTLPAVRFTYPLVRRRQAVGLRAGNPADVFVGSARRASASSTDSFSDRVDEPPSVAVGINRL